MKLPFTIYDLRFTICRKSGELSIFNHPLSIANHKFQRAFTLVELLTVLAIMAIIAGLAVPALKNFGQSDAMTAAGQQMLGDVARARQLAMSQRTTVYMVFVPTNFWDLPCTYNGNIYPTLQAGVGAIKPASAQPPILIALTNLCADQFTGYTFMSYGNVGDQPGQHRWHYLTPWQTLPQGIFIFTNLFNLARPGIAVSSANPVSAPAIFRLWNQAYPHPDQNTICAFDTGAFPIPTADSPQVLLPCISFNYLGQLTTNGVDVAGVHEYIPLSRGIVAPAIDANTKAYILANPPVGLPQVVERPPGNTTNTYNIINIDPLTGRATLEKPKVQ